MTETMNPILNASLTETQVDARAEAHALFVAYCWENRPPATLLAAAASAGLNNVKAEKIRQKINKDASLRTRRM